MDIEKPKVKTFPCSKCMREIAVNDVFMSDCGCKYCQKCLIEMMQKSLSEDNERLKCVGKKKTGEDCVAMLDNVVLKNADEKLYHSYNLACLKKEFPK